MATTSGLASQVRKSKRLPLLSWVPNAGKREQRAVVTLNQRANLEPSRLPLAGLGHRHEAAPVRPAQRRSLERTDEVAEVGNRSLLAPGSGKPQLMTSSMRLPGSSRTTKAERVGNSSGGGSRSGSGIIRSESIPKCSAISLGWRRCGSDCTCEPVYSSRANVEPRSTI
jgi:hypothetical protein